MRSFNLILLVTGCITKLYKILLVSNKIIHFNQRKLVFYAFATRRCYQRYYVFRLPRLPRSSVCPFVWTDLVTMISHEWLETYRQYSLAPTDDLIRFWRSKVKVSQQAVEVAKASASMVGHQSPSGSIEQMCSGREFR